MTLLSVGLLVGIVVVFGMGICVGIWINARSLMPRMVQHCPKCKTDLDLKWR